MNGERPCVIVAAGGSSWEAELLPRLSAAGLVVLKRCVDVQDLMSSAATGQADVAVVAGQLRGLDGDCVAHLLRYDVRTVAIHDEESTVTALARIGVALSLPATDLEGAIEGIAAVCVERSVPGPEPAEPAPLPVVGGRGAIVAVWGSTGAPGRTTVALGIAGEHAASGAATVLVDADGYGGTLAQHLGVLDEVSGVLSAARLANAGELEAASFARCRRRVGECLELLTGLPRADRWSEVRSGVLDQILGLATAVGDVVVDCGFCLEEDFDHSRGVGRNQLTLDSLALATAVVVVGTAEPTGLARLARGLVELRDLVAGLPVHVVVNRMRGSLGWSQHDIAGMVEGYARPASLHFLSEERASLDRALVAGRGLSEVGESPLRRQLAQLAQAALGSTAAPAR